MISESSVQAFYYTPKAGWKFSIYYDGPKMWKAACNFQVNVELDPKLKTSELTRIEYRQYIRGGVWVKRGNQKWTDDDKPNGNAKFPIPPYDGESCPGLPHEAVTGSGLSLRWKEDGQIEKGKVERYGHRTTATLLGENEADYWMPDNMTGATYYLRDSPSIAGEWGSGEKATVWIELWFQGFVVEVEPAKKGVRSKPIRVLRRRSWECFWQDKTLT